MSYEFRGTPGEWFQDKYGNVKSEHSKAPTKAIPVVGLCLSQGEEAEANAQLIAAAPELFEALNELLGHVSSVQVGSVYDEARAALAKATATGQDQ